MERDRSSSPSPLHLNSELDRFKLFFPTAKHFIKRSKNSLIFAFVSLSILVLFFMMHGLIYRDLNQKNYLQRKIDQLEFQKEVLEMKLTALTNKYSDSNFFDFEKKNQLTISISNLNNNFDKMNKLLSALTGKSRDLSSLNFSSTDDTNTNSNNNNNNNNCIQNDDNCLMKKGKSQLPYCTDGATPGRWVNNNTWESDTCQYKNVSTEELRDCLAGKWVHFYGDSLVRLMANEFANKAGMRRTNWAMNKTRNVLLDTAMESSENSTISPKRKTANLVRVTYLFRAKMAHQRHPRPGTNGNRDLNNEFLIELMNGGTQPNFLVLSVGAHEAIGWNSRPHPELDLQLFKNDTEEFLQQLKISFTKGKLIWCKAHFIWPGKVAGEDYAKVKAFHEASQEYAFRRFREEGYLTMDFYQTTLTRQDMLISGDGVHYGGAVLAEHTRMLAHVICKPD